MSITSPTNGSVISGKAVTVKIAANDNVGVTKVLFYVDGNLKATLKTAPYNYNWSIGTLAKGTHRLTAKAYDAAGNVGTSPSISVTK